MKTLRLELSLSNLGEQTHIWFPAPQGKFSITPTEIQLDEKYENKIAYFYKESPWPTPMRLLNRIKIQAVFPISKISSSSRPGIGAQFLRPNRSVQSDNAVIRKLANTLTKKLQTDEEKVRRCFDFVVGYLTYANPIRGLYSSLQALSDRSVDCGGFSTLLAALLRAGNIPARCIFGWAIQSKFGYHAWVEFFDQQKHFWIPCDPSVAHLGKRTKLDAGFGFIHDERVTFSVGEDLVLEGNGINWPVPLLQSPVVVSLNRRGLPVAPSEKLEWKVLY